MPYYRLMILFWLSAGSSFACDLCNCYFTVLPDDRRHILGLRYRYSVYSDHTSTAGILGKAFHEAGGKEIYSTLEVWGRYQLNPTWYLEVALPYRSIHMGSEHSTGIGDMTVLAFREMWRNDVRNEDSWRARWMMGGGLRAPTGRSLAQLGEDPHFFPGTGNWTGLISEQFIARYRSWGLSHSASYGASLGHSRDYRPANSFSASASIFYQKTFSRNLTLIPLIGVNAETADRDQLGGLPLSGTGGTAWLAQAGMDVYFNHVQLHTSIQSPVYQHWNDDAPNNGFRVSLGMSWLFEAASSISPKIKM